MADLYFNHAHRADLAVNIKQAVFIGIFGIILFRKRGDYVHDLVFILHYFGNSERGGAFIICGILFLNNVGFFDDAKRNLGIFLYRVKLMTAFCAVKIYAAVIIQIIERNGIRSVVSVCGKNAVRCIF